MHPCVCVCLCTVFQRFWAIVTRTQFNRLKRYTLYKTKITLFIFSLQGLFIIVGELYMSLPTLLQCVMNVIMYIASAHQCVKELRVSEHLRYCFYTKLCNYCEGCYTLAGTSLSLQLHIYCLKLGGLSTRADGVQVCGRAASFCMH